MLKKLVKTYYKLLDEKLENGTVVVLIIALLIVWVSIAIQDASAWRYSKASIFETNLNMSYQSNIYQNSILEINGIRYKIHLEEINK